MHEDEDLIRRLQAWQIEPPPDDLAGRIAREASRVPQRRPLWRQLETGLARLLTEWRYGLAFKAAALAVCAIAGLAVGQIAGTGVESELDVLALALAEGGWGGGL